jgi:hypothetical protein
MPAAQRALARRQKFERGVFARNHEWKFDSLARKLGDRKDVAGADLDDALFRFEGEISRVVFPGNTSFHRIWKSTGFGPQGDLNPVADRQYF